MTATEKGNLPRLNRQFYQGAAVVFWTNTVEQRSRGWLTPTFHAQFREVMLHAAARYDLLCPAYCLMPDHLHLIWMGTRSTTDQLTAMKFLRTCLKPALRNGREWQHQAHDHVLRQEERLQNAFERFCLYTLSNPVRAGLVADRERWQFIGAIIPGFPEAHPLRAEFWDWFWTRYRDLRQNEDH